MNRKKVLYVVLFSLVCLTAFVFTDPLSREESLSSIRGRGELVVAIDPELPGYFSFNGEPMGYQYDLLASYAERLGVGLTVVGGLQGQADSCAENLRRPDLTVALLSDIDRASLDRALTVYNTGYVVLGHRSESPVRTDGDLHKMLRNRKVCIAEGFVKSKSYHNLLDSASTSDLYLSSTSDLDLMQKLSDWEYDYLICERSEAALGCAMIRNIRTVYDFSEPVAVDIVVGGNFELYADFKTWLDGFVRSEECAALQKTYFDGGLIARAFEHGGNLRNGTISRYDDLIRKVSSEHGCDWRFVSAVAYSESRFNRYMVSNRGARGLMQIMPSVARQFDVPAGEVMDPERNIALGVMLIKKIENSIRFGSGTPESDRMSIVLAAYNAGIGHVQDARKLARKYGENPDSWECVSRYLGKKSDEQYWSDEVVKNGVFRGVDETAGFVAQVMRKYNSYCNYIAMGR